MDMDELKKLPHDELAAELRKRIGDITDPDQDDMEMFSAIVSHPQHIADLVMLRTIADRFWKLGHGEAPGEGQAYASEVHQKAAQLTLHKVSHELDEVAENVLTALAEMMAHLANCSCTHCMAQQAEMN